MTKLSASAQKIQHYLEAQNTWEKIQSPNFPRELALVILKRSAIYLRIPTHQIEDVITEVLIYQFEYPIEHIQTIWQTVKFMGDNSVRMVFFDYISENLEHLFEENTPVTFQDIQYHIQILETEIKHLREMLTLIRTQLPEGMTDNVN